MIVRIVSLKYILYRVIAAYPIFIHARPSDAKFEASYRYLRLISSIISLGNNIVSNYGNLNTSGHVYVCASDRKRRFIHSLRFKIDETEEAPVACESYKRGIISYEIMREICVKSLRLIFDVTRDASLFKNTMLCSRALSNNLAPSSV